MFKKDNGRSRKRGKLLSSAGVSTIGRLFACVQGLCFANLVPQLRSLLKFGQQKWQQETSYKLLLGASACSNQLRIEYGWYGTLWFSYSTHHTRRFFVLTALQDDPVPRLSLASIWRGFKKIKEDAERQRVDEGCK